MKKLNFTVWFLLFIICFGPLARAQDFRKSINLSGEGWSLWRDTLSTWADDDKHLYIFDDASGKYKRDDNPHVVDDHVAGDISIAQLRKQLPNNSPTGGWDKLNDQNKEASVSVPGTVDEYLWGKGGKNNPYETNGRYLGVSWWWRRIAIPLDWNGKKIILHLRSTCYRAEIFIDETLVRYDLVSGTPYDVDITPYVEPGKTYRLAIRITNPGGSFSWDDNTPLMWGNSGLKVFPEHGFSGITGDVLLDAVDPAYISNLFIENTAEDNFRKVKCHVSINNTTSGDIRGDLTMVVRDKATGNIMYQKKLNDLTIHKGKQIITYDIVIADAKLWEINQGNLYQCEVVLDTKNAKDNLSADFGFRWFTVKGNEAGPSKTKNGGNANLYLNGKRVRIFTAISWGFWGITGLFPTPELNIKNIEAAKALGLNMLYNHRHLASELMLAPADKAGLLNLCEMGGIEHVRLNYKIDNGVAKGGTYFGINAAINRQKVLRTIIRDRNHPSVVIHTMVNEAITEPSVQQIKDMNDAHALAPDEILVWAGGQTFTPRSGENENGAVKTWYNSGEVKRKTFGWADEHGTGTIQCYYDEMYNNPDDYVRHSDYNKEVRVYSEEAAVGSPSRYDKVKKYFNEHPNARKGWDGDDNILRYDAMDKFLQTSGMGKYYTVTSLINTLCDKTFYLQGRRLENFKISNANDFYSSNGWENDKSTSLSGFVDDFRNIKAGNPALLTNYSKPLYVAVKLRNKVIQSGDTVIGDFYLVNEGKLPGGIGKLKVILISPSGKETSLFTKENVRFKGGDRFSTLMVSNVSIPTSNEPGYSKVEAQFIIGNQTITGEDDIFAVDWKDTNLSRNGAIIGQDTIINRFLHKAFGFKLSEYQNSLSKLDYMICYGDNVNKYLSPEILQRVKQDGTKLIVLEADEDQLKVLTAFGVIDNPGKWYNVSAAAPWLGATYFDGQNNLLKGLPQKTALSWECQNLYKTNRNVRSVDLKGVHPIIAVWNGDENDDGEKDMGIRMATINPTVAMFAKRYGNGIVLVSTLPLIDNLISTGKATDTMKKLFLNCIANKPDTITN